MNRVSHTPRRDSTGSKFKLIHYQIAQSPQRNQHHVVVQSHRSLAAFQRAQQIMGSIFMFEYLIQPMTILLGFFMLEGFVRSIAAVGSDEVLPSFPLQVMAFLHRYLSARSHERRLGQRLRDEVQPVAADSLQIASCRPKPWTQLTTISDEGIFYELVGENEGPAPRPFVYILRKKPTTAAIRGIHEYNPDEALEVRK